MSKREFSKNQTPKVHNKYHKTAPPDAVYVGRGTPFGNPFVIGKDGDRDYVCDKFEEYLTSNPNLVQRVRKELKGEDLLCFCKPCRCHADTLLKIANESPEFKLVVAGGREFSDYGLMKRTLDTLLVNKKNTHNIQIVSGKAKGADSLGERYAADNGFKILPYPADWNTNGKAAGPIRNSQMLNVCDAVVVYWDGVSRGSKNMIDITKKSGKMLRVIKYSGA